MKILSRWAFTHRNAEIFFLILSLTSSVSVVLIVQFWAFRFIFTYIHSTHSSIAIRPEVFVHFFVASKLSGKNLPGVPNSACLISASRRTIHWATENPLRWAATYCFTPHPTELRRPLLSYTAPYWATPHPWWGSSLHCFSAYVILSTMLLLLSPPPPHPLDLYILPFFAPPSPPFHPKHPSPSYTDTYTDTYTNSSPKSSHLCTWEISY